MRSHGLCADGATKWLFEQNESKERRTLPHTPVFSPLFAGPVPSSATFGLPECTAQSKVLVWRDKGFLNNVLQAPTWQWWMVLWVLAVFLGLSLRRWKIWEAKGSWDTLEHVLSWWILWVLWVFFFLYPVWCSGKTLQAARLSSHDRSQDYCSVSGERQFHHQGSGCVMMPDVADIGVTSHNCERVRIGEMRRRLYIWEQSRLEVRRRLCISAKILSWLWQKSFVLCQRVTMWVAPLCLFIWAHYPDLSVTGFVTLSSPIRAAAFCCTPHKLLLSTTSFTLPHTEIEMEIRDTRETKCHARAFLGGIRLNADTPLTYAKTSWPFPNSLPGNQNPF